MHVLPFGKKKTTLPRTHWPPEADAQARIRANWRAPFGDRRQELVFIGDTLDRISARYYGDPTKWRSIANANGIGDPLDLRPGRLLAIPERGV